MSRVLIVEDDEWLAEQYERTLQKIGHETLVVPHPLAAIRSIDDFKTEVIILDVLLTGGTAFPLLHELQSYQDTGSIPVILCTNLANELNFDDLKPYGVRRVLDKTVMEPNDLIAAVRSVSE